MKDLIQASVLRPVFAWMLMASMIVFGALSFRSLGVSQLPDIDFPYVNVSVAFEGAAPEVMELDIIEPIESALMGVGGIRTLSSTARSGVANISVEFEIEKNIDIAVQEVQSKLSQVQRVLPSGVEPPIVTKSNPEDQPILWLSVSSTTMSPATLMAYVRDSVRDDFAKLPGVADVMLGGYVDPAVRVWVDPKKLQKYSLSILDVVRSIQSEQKEFPSGRFETEQAESNVRTLGEVGQIEELKDLQITRRGGQPIFSPLPLKTVAHVEMGLDEVRRRARAMGNPAVGLGIKKQRGENSVSIARAVRAQMERSKAKLPEGLDIGINFDTTTFIDDSIYELILTIALASILTSLVCWLFLGTWTSTLNVVLAIPTSLLATFLVLRFFGFTLNTFTLLALSLAVGIVVDDAIMVLENIFRHREMGKNRLTAALDGANEISFAAMVATLAIVAIFLPVAFMDGLIGKYFFQFGVALSAAVAFSLLEAITLTPMRCGQFLAADTSQSRLVKGFESGFSWIQKAYIGFVPQVLEHRGKTLFAGVLISVLGSLSFISIKKEFSPPQDQSRLLLRVRLPEGSSLDATDAMAKRVEDTISRRDDVVRYFGSVGGFGGGDVNTAMIFITLKPIAERRLSQQEIADELRKEFRGLDGAKVVIQDLSLSGFGGGRGFPVEFSLQGNDWSELIESSLKMTKAMEGLGTVTDIDSDYRGSTSELRILPDRAKAQLRGVSISDIGAAVSATLGGTIAGKLTSGGRRFDIRVKAQESRDADFSRVSQISIPNNRGELIPLGELAEVKREPALLSISRSDRVRTIKMFASLAPGSAQNEVMAHLEQESKKVLPPSVKFVSSGSSQQFKDSFQSLLFALFLGVVISYMILAAQFNSFVHPFTILSVLPLSVTGAGAALLAFSQSLNVYSLIGILLLMGIAKKNSILIVEFANQLREQGMDVRGAVLEATRSRFRPILMTSLSTVVGAIPAALASGPGSETRIPMAVAVIGGVVVSTLLSLFVVPALYLILQRKPKDASF